MSSLARVEPSGPLAVRLRLEGSLDTTNCLPARGRCSQPAILRTFTGEGSLSGAGKVRLHATHCDYLTSDGRPSGRYEEGEMAMFTVTGEEIHATCDRKRIEPTRCLELIRITGGTGGYEEAIGTLIAIVKIDPTTHRLSIAGWGWMAL